MKNTEISFVDMHTHSENSADATGSVVQMCEAAIEAGLSGFAVTDHCEVEPYREDRYDVSARQSYFDTVRAKEIFRGQIELLAGVELGYSKLSVATAERIVTAYPYDVVLGSMHTLPGRLDFYFLDYTQEDRGRLFADYLEELYAMACWGKFDVLTHITYPLRYMGGPDVGGMVQGEAASSVIDVMDYEAEITRIFKKIIEKHIALELNISGLRKPQGEMIPSLELLKLYRSLGGELLTIGTDAHNAHDLGLNFRQAIEAVSQAGFTGYCKYVKRQPEFIRF